MSEWKETDFGKVPSSWEFVSATEFCKKVTDGTHDSPKQQSKGNYLITSKHIRGRNIEFEKAYLISETDFNKINERSKVDQWDVIISMIGEYCGFAYIERNEDIKYAVKNVGLFKTANKDNAFWLYYYIQSNIGKNHLDNCKSGTSQPYITLGTLRDYPILVPNSSSEKRAIVSVISSLDDKIDLLHRQNATLEAMAETLFRQMMSEHDLYGLQDGQDKTGSEESSQSINPKNHVQDKEAKEDWKEGTLDDILTVKGGTTPSTAEPTYWNGKIHWTSPRDITNLNGIYLFDTERKITELGLSKISSGLLPQGTLLMSSRAPVGVLAFSEVPVAINQGYIAILDNKGYSKEFIYLWLKINIDIVHSFSNGSTFMEISKSAFKTMQLQIPPKQVLSNFQILVKPLFEKIKSNQIQIRTLTALRDTLLPKLMSGEVRVNN
jgi:type I restriction enzyme S subunit